MKKCKACGEDKPLEDYYVTSDKKGHFPECKPCNRKRGLRNHAARHAADPNYYRRRNLWTNYKITLEEYDEIAARQEWACAICKRRDWSDRERAFLNVDHDHETGAVRGLLCTDCNTAIGSLGDDPDRLMAAAVYLLSHQNVLVF